MKRQLRASIFVAAVTCAASGFIIAYDLAVHANQWLAVHSAGLCVSILVLLVTLHIRKGTINGANRRTNPQVHSDPDTGATAISGAVVAPATPKPSAQSLTHPRKRTVERTGVVIGEVIAFRCWRVAGDYLLSMNGAVWLPDQPMVGAGVDVYNSCGVHAFKTLDDALRYTGQGWICAIGEVRLWGTIVEHKTGYRGEKARVHRITIAWNRNREDMPAVALRIAERYSLVEESRG